MKLILVGGFLGSGKTTAIVRASTLLMRENKKVAVITNDQGEQQVDSAYVGTYGIPVQEVSNGCFCCRYEALDQHIRSLENQHHPEIIFAESVGSCTDLIATVAKPLLKTRPDLRIVISVFADGELFASILEGRSSFVDDSVRYIYKKQLEEADLLVISKSELLTTEQHNKIATAVRTEYPGKQLLFQNAFADDHVAHWIRHINQFDQNTKRSSIAIDYDVYGKGEAMLAWFDQSMIVSAGPEDPLLITEKIIQSIFNHIHERHWMIGHLKFFIEADSWKEKISFTATSNFEKVRLNGPKVSEVRLLINARIQTEPESLSELINDVMTKAARSWSCVIATEKLSAFKPGYPTPTHRIGD